MRVALLGPASPAIGGIATHVDNLALRLREAGDQAMICDYLEPAGGGRIAGALHVVRSIRAARRFADVGGVVHLHMASGRSLPLFVPWIREMVRVAPLVVTIHGGAFPALVRSYPRVWRCLLGEILRSARCVIGVNESIADALVDVVGVTRARVRVISPYVPVTVTCDSPSERTAERTPGTVVAAGYCQPLYGFEELVRALRETAFRRAQLVMYGQGDERYRLHIVNAVRGDSRFEIRESLTRSEFARVLQGATVFARPTTADGDSIAVREALAAGCRVVASDCVSRPDGCLVYQTRSHESLVTALRESLETSEVRHPMPSALADAFDAIRSVYRAACEPDDQTQSVGLTSRAAR